MLNEKGKNDVYWVKKSGLSSVLYLVPAALTVNLMGLHIPTLFKQAK